MIKILEPPTLINYFGTDSLGRDYFSICIESLRNSFVISVFSAFFVLLMGALIGAYFALQPKWVQNIFLRGLDIFSAIPQFLFATIFSLALQSFLGAKIPNAILVIMALVLVHWATIARLFLGKIQTLALQTYVEYSRSLGASIKDLIKMHFFSACKTDLINTFIIQVQINIIYEGSLTYLGLGVQSPQTSIGNLIREGWSVIAFHPHIILFPALLLTTFLLLLEVLLLKLNSENRFKR